MHPYSQATKKISQTAGSITPLAVDFARVSFGPLVLNVKYIIWGEGRQYLLNGCDVPGSVLRGKCVLSHITLLTVLERSADNYSVLQMGQLALRKVK